MMMFSHTTGAIAGFVRLNGRTVGSVSSGATERPNADCQALFLFLWPDTGLAVSGGRGVNAAADWAANKTLALPDWRGYNLSALDDMGNTASGRLSLLGAQATTLGGSGGTQSNSLAAANLPGHTHSGTTGNDSPDHTHGYTLASLNGITYPSGGGVGQGLTTSASSTGGASARHTHGFTTDSGAGLSGSAFGIVSPRKLITFYMKL
jgi:hypothetical protein